MKHWLGSLLLRWALSLLPLSSSDSIGARRGLAEQRRYERYEALTRLCGNTAPLPFDSWREEWRWMTREVHRRLPEWKQTDAQLDAALGQVVRFRRRRGDIVPMRKASR